MCSQSTDTLRQAPQKPRNLLISWALRVSLAALSFLLVWSFGSVGLASGQDVYQGSVSNSISLEDPPVDSPAQGGVLTEKASSLNQAEGPTLPRAAEPVSLAWLESSMLQTLNQLRAQAGLPPLVADPTLTWVARQRSNDMAVNNYFSHTAPDGSNYISLLGRQGIASGVVGEILGRNNAADELSVSMVAEAFMKSPPHRLHIVYSDYQWIGVGVAKGEGNMKYFAIIFRGP